MSGSRLRWFVAFIAGGALVAGALLAWLHGVRESREVPHEEAVAPAAPTPAPWMTQTTIGTSVQGRAIDAYTYGTGTNELLFVGGMHGGYEWNSVLLAYQAMDYLAAHPELIVQGMRVTIIPSINPDGVFAVTQKEGRFTAEEAMATSTASGLGRVNAHGVDLNRNFGCKWQPKAVWRGTPVGAGTGPFSEPEAQTFKSYIEAHRPHAVVFWHSKSNAVYASECTAGILPGTRLLMTAYAHAAGYPAVDAFTAYPVTGDAEGWLASIGIPAITVELSTHETTEWDKNLAGIRAVLSAFSQ